MSAARRSALPERLLGLSLALGSGTRLASGAAVAGAPAQAAAGAPPAAADLASSQAEGTRRMATRLLELSRALAPEQDLFNGPRMVPVWRARIALSRDPRKLLGLRYQLSL